MLSSGRRAGLRGRRFDSAGRSACGGGGQDALGTAGAIDAADGRAGSGAAGRAVGCARGRAGEVQLRACVGCTAVATARLGTCSERRAARAGRRLHRLAARMPVAPLARTRLPRHRASSAAARAPVRHRSVHARGGRGAAGGAALAAGGTRGAGGGGGALWRVRRWRVGEQASGEGRGGGRRGRISLLRCMGGSPRCSRDYGPHAACQGSRRRAKRCAGHWPSCRVQLRTGRRAGVVDRGRGCLRRTRRRSGGAADCF